VLWDGFEERTVNLKKEQDRAAVQAFLARFGLTFDATVEYTVALYRDEQIIATGSLAGEVLRNIAVDESLQGEGLTAAVVSHLMREASRRGCFHYFIYTKPAAAHLFGGLGFNEIARTEPYAVLLESGIGSISDYCRDLACAVSRLPPGPRAALVVNCNPFTLGHQAVIAKAAAENAAVVVMVVEEDRSLFPFEARLRLVREGLSEFDNILVLPGGKYVISAATFPGYFTRGEETVLAQTRLDAAVFAQYIAPALAVTCRYVGEEPYCAVTESYNQALLEILPPRGIEVVIIPRIMVDGAPISASRVRELIRQSDWEEIRRLVPKGTYDYLRSGESRPVLNAITQSRSRH
jgi:[citrate (pro-3S)-lyase] ligase